MILVLALSLSCIVSVKDSVREAELKAKVQAMLQKPGDSTPALSTKAPPVETKSVNHTDPVRPQTTSSAFPATTRYEVGFSPNAGSLPLILKVIDSAKSELLVATYSFTSEPISLALKRAFERGVKVRVVSDDGEATKSYSAVTFLANQKIPVRINPNYSIHHHKFIVADRRTLETGSFNFSAAAASSNAENVLVIWNAPTLASIYATEWERLWEESKDLPPKY